MNAGICMAHTDPGEFKNMLYFVSPKFTLTNISKFEQT